ncbi:MAG: D-glycerate dehydrogenase [Candidatus Sungbacteria bacterium]|nr:D-glycerate dehydrogenase [Candidatus Sungbacteria bacterium]
MKIFITRLIPDKGINLLKEKGYEVVVSPHDRVLTKNELIDVLQKDRYDAVLCLLTDKIDAEVLSAAGPQCKIFANYAVGFDNIDLKAVAEKGVMASNTPGVLTDSVAEHTFALLLAIAHRVAEADRFTRAGKYMGWEPMLFLGESVSGKTLGIMGLGRIGSRVAYHAKRGFDMRVLYYDVKQNGEFEKEFQAEFRANPDDIFKEADFISIHVPLLDSTRHMVNKERIHMMKKTGFLVNTSRGPVIDELALVDALKNGVIAGAALDVFEHEPELASGLRELENVILTPHIASATEGARQAMSETAALNIIEALEGRTPPNLVKI